jgi:hypothetical protein
MRRDLVGYCVCLFLACCARGPNLTSEQLPLRRVVVYRNGVAYYERAGHVDANEVKFRMRQQMVGDFLATLAIVETGGSSVRSASFPIKVEDQADSRAREFQELLRADFNGTPKQKNPLRDVTLKLDGNEHDLAIGYVAETPVWRPSYRVVIDKKGKAELQSWGIIENLSGENWSDVELVLVAGAPLAFQSNLGQPVTPQRPMVSDTGEVIDTMPEGVTSVAESKGPVDRYEPESKPPPAPAPVAAPMEEAAESSDEADEKRSLALKKTRAAAKSAGAGRGKLDLQADGAAKPTGSSSLGYGAGAPGSSVANRAIMRAGAPSAPRNVSALAAVAVQSGATRYELPFRVTIPDESATMVLLMQQPVPGEAVFLFAPDNGVADSASHPFRVARFSNSTKGLLERGPVAVFEKGSFLGQGLLDSLPPGATATVPFALERAVGVQSELHVDERGARLARIELGTLLIERDSVYRTTYKVQNGADDESKLLIRHLRRPGTRLYRPPVGTEDNTGAGNALVPVVVRGRGRAELVVDERAASQQRTDWLSDLAEEAVSSFLKDERVDRGQRDSLSAAWLIRQQWKKLDDEQSVLSRERSELERTQQELRSNLEAIRKNEQAGDLRRKLTKKLDESTSRFDKVQKRLVELSVTMREHQIRFEDAIRDLKIASVPAPRD